MAARLETPENDVILLRIPCCSVGWSEMKKKKKKKKTEIDGASLSETVDSF